MARVNHVAVITAAIVYWLLARRFDESESRTARHRTALMTYMYEARPLGLWAIDTGYQAFSLAVMGAIIGAFRKRSVEAAA